VTKIVISYQVVELVLLVDFIFLRHVGNQNHECTVVVESKFYVITYILLWPFWDATNGLLLEMLKTIKRVLSITDFSYCM